MKNRRLPVIIAAVVASVVVTLIGARHKLSDEPAKPTTQLHATTAQLDAALPNEMPASVFGEIADSSVESSNGKTRITVRLPPAADDRVTIVVLADKLRNRGWNVEPTTDAGHQTLTGYGWTGDLRTLADNGGVELTLLAVR